MRVPGVNLARRCLLGRLRCRRRRPQPPSQTAAAFAPDRGPHRCVQSVTVECPTASSPRRRLYGQAQFVGRSSDQDGAPLGKRPGEFRLMIVNGLSVALQTGEHDWDMSSLQGTQDAADAGVADNQIGLLHQPDYAVEGQEVVSNGAARSVDWSMLDRQIGRREHLKRPHQPLEASRAGAAGDENHAMLPLDCITSVARRSPRSPRRAKRVRDPVRHPSRDQVDSFCCRPGA